MSTVVDRQFAENLPMNGRSFQTLIQLTPGVVAYCQQQQLTLANSVSTDNAQPPTTGWWTA